MKKLNIICLLLMIAIRVCAQTDSVVISKSQLCGTRWEQTFPSSKYSSDEIMFKDSVIVDDVYFRSMDERVMNSFEYYITDKLPSYSIFYRKYVGQERTGCYIVEYNSKVKRVDYYIVVSLTEKELVLYHRATPGQIPNLDTYIKYRRIDENKNYPDTISLQAQNFHKENLVNTTRNGDNAVADGIVVRDSQGKLFDKIYVEHKDVGSLTNLSWIKDGEISVYISKQEEVIKHIKATMLRKIPVQFLRSSIEYKFNPIICHLAVSACDGVIRKVSFQVNREISYLLSDNDIMALEDIVLNTQFIPYNPETGDYISIFFPVGKKLISEFLNSGNREDCP